MKRRAQPFLKVEDAYRNTQLTQKADIAYVTANSDVAFSAVSSDETWCTAKVLSNKKERNLQINIKANNTPSERQADINAVIAKANGF